MGTGLSASYHILSECPTLQETPQVHLSLSTPILPFEPLGRHHCTQHRHAWLNLWPLVTKSAIRPSPQWLCAGLRKSPHLALVFAVKGISLALNPLETSLPRTLNSSCVRTQRWRPNTYSPIPSHPSTFRRLPSPNRNGSGKCFWLSPGTLAPPKQLCLFSWKAR